MFPWQTNQKIDGLDLCTMYAENTAKKESILQFFPPQDSGLFLAKALSVICLDEDYT